ncbi:hypothetical protein [Streptomyces sp. NPDC088246]|uniref:hypothetical protein n=1 Tax=Streptomyces sp. NPDC088246 TaxID=3365842 RepID=UPI0038293BF8
MIASGESQLRVVAHRPSRRPESASREQSRAVATRYDKRGYVFLGTVTTAALLIWLRT